MKWLSKHWQKLAFAGLIFTILIFSAFLIMSPRLWKKYNEAEILRNGQSASDTTLYQSRNGLLFIDMGSNDESYIFTNERPHLLLCNSPRYIRLPGYVYMVDDQNMPCVVYGVVKASDPHLTVEHDYIEFDSRKGGRIRIKWKPRT
jgi:hypothetical protein